MRVSICVPTYNRAAYLPELFDSILAQKGYACELEVVISDNASSDETPEIVEHYRSRFDHLIYFRADQNMGADRNFLRVVEIATGDYCWLMGSDDKLEPDAISIVEKVISDYPDVAGISVRRNLYDANMNDLPYPKMENLNRPFDHIQMMEGADNIFKALGDYVGYLSGNVLPRKLWNEVVSEFPVEKFYNAWVHVYVIGQMMKKNPKWVYVPFGCVGWRMHNDFFLSDGMYRRLEIDVVGYSDITEAVFGKNSDVYHYMMGHMMRHARHRILHARASGHKRDFTVKARALINNYYKPFPLLRAQMLPALYTPQPVLAFVSKARHVLMNKRPS